MKQINTIEGFEEIRDCYFIATCGKVISTYTKKFKILKQGTYRTGYSRVNLVLKSGKTKTCSIHRLVALAYILNPENKPEVNHINEVRIDNYIGNLNWMTSKENCNHGTKSERIMGKNNHGAKSKEYYTTKPTKRYGFKRTCDRMGWNFEDFIEINSGEKYSNNEAKYYYQVK